MNDIRTVYTVRTPHSVSVYATREAAIAQKRLVADNDVPVEIERHLVDIANAELENAS